MAAKWQQWMPFHIDRFRGSQAVQAMHPAGRMGYLYLLASAWQTADCTLPNDPIDLASESGLGDELWAVHGPRIMRNFVVLENGRLQNSVLLIEWKEAQKVFNRRQEAAEKTNEYRRSHGDRAHTVTVRPRSAHTRTLTGTGTSTEKQKQKPLAKDKPSPDPRAAAFRQSFGNYFQALNSAPAPWDAKEATRLSKFLQANPTITPEQWTRILNNRRRSPVAHGKRLSVWIDTALSWLAGPADEWGKAINATGGSNGQGNIFGNHKSKTSGNFDEARAALSILAGEELGSTSDGEAGKCIEGHFSPVRQ